MTTFIGGHKVFIINKGINDFQTVKSQIALILFLLLIWQGFCLQYIITASQFYNT